MELQAQEKRSLMKSYLNEEIFKKYSSERKLFVEEDLHLFLQSDTSKKVLVVEDDLAQMNLIEELLCEINPNIKIDWEHDADRAIGKVAYESARGEGYDIVISDIELGPGSSGMDLFRYCIEFEPAIETVLVSAHSREKLRVRHFIDSEPIDYLKKPINFQAFYQKMAPKLASF